MSSKAETITCVIGLTVLKSKPCLMIMFQEGEIRGDLYGPVCNWQVGIGKFLLYDKKLFLGMLKEYFELYELYFYQS